MWQFGHCVWKCLNDLTGQLSLYGSVMGSGPLCPLKRLIFSSALSNGLLLKFKRCYFLFLIFDRVKSDLLTSYNIHKPNTCTLYSMKTGWTLTGPLLKLCHLFWNWSSQTVPVPIEKHPTQWCLRNKYDWFHVCTNSLENTNLIWKFSNFVTNHFNSYLKFEINLGKYG